MPASRSSDVLVWSLVVTIPGSRERLAANFPFLAWFGRRAGQALLTLLIFATLMFFAVGTLIPYDYATQFRLNGGIETVDSVSQALGLDRPLWARYLDYLGGLLTGSLGTSFSGSPVLSSIVGALPVTLLIFGTGAVVAFLIGSALGRWAAWHRSRTLRSVVTSVSVVLYTAFPPWLVFLLVYFLTDPLLSLRRGLGLPIDSRPLWRDSLASESDVLTIVAIGVMIGLIGGLLVGRWARRREFRLLSMVAVPAALVGVAVAIGALGIGRQALDLLVFRSSVEVSIGAGSPVIATLAFVLLVFGEFVFLFRAGISGEMSEDYVLTARAKGLRERVVRDHHVARNAVLPVLSRSFTGVPYVLTGLVIIEQQLSIDGLSSLLLGAVRVVDVPVILGTLVFVGFITLCLRLGLDVVHARIDPRIRLGAAS